MAYGSKSGIQGIFGVTNVSIWSDLDNDANETNKNARIAQAIAVNDMEIDEYLEDTEYKVPIQDKDGNTPVSIADLSNKMCGVWLVHCRGGDSLAEVERKAKEELLAYKAGTRKIKGAV